MAFPVAALPKFYLVLGKHIVLENGVGPEILSPEIQEWLVTYITNGYRYGVDVDENFELNEFGEVNDIHRHPFLEFQNERDAFYFKMRWL